jgi:ribonuclease D
MNPASDNPQPSDPAASSAPDDRRGKSPRLHHRARNHQSAHAPGTGSEDGQVMDHPLVPCDRAELITTQEALSRLLDELRAAGSFAYDSEFIGERSYLPQLCLIQVGLPKRIALIDPLADLNLMPFWAIIADPAIEKIVHAGQQDVEPVFRMLGRPPANLFDTQIAAGFIHLPYPLSLTKLVQELVGARLGKGLTFTSWDQRPLSGQQLHYAADDVRYLPAARAELARRLDAAGHTAWAKEESQTLCHGGPCRFDPEDGYLKIRGASGLDPRNLAVLRELAIWRDAAAQSADLPPRTLLKDEILLGLARNPAGNLDKLSRVRGLPRPLESAEGPAIVAATQRALALPANQLPDNQFFEPSPREKFQSDAMWATAQSICYGQGIDPALVGSRQDIGELRRHPSGSEHRLVNGWRKAAVGAKLVEMLRV